MSRLRALVLLRISVLRLRSRSVGIEGVDVTLGTARTTGPVTGLRMGRSPFRQYGWHTVALLALALVVMLAAGCSGAAGDAESTTQAPPSEAEESAADGGQADATIVAGEGWGVLQLGATMDSMKEEFGAPDATTDYDDTVFHYYADDGFYINYSNPAHEVQALFFQSGTGTGDTQFVAFVGSTDEGIDWDSTPQDVLDAYGSPQDDFQSDDEGFARRRLVYPGISFRFEDEALVEIGVGAD